MTELERKIQEASQQYYSEGDSELTDSEFDALISELRQVNPDSEILKQVGTGYNVEIDSTPGAKVRHKYGTAGSLEKAYTFNEIKGALKEEIVNVSLKLDGISTVLYYEQGNLKLCLTRGDGTTGIDITDKLVSAHLVPTTLKDRIFTGAVRGEILMSQYNWETFSKHHTEAKNSRNSTAGLINSNNPDIQDLKLLTVVVYTIVGIEHISYPILTMGLVEDWLRHNFEYVVPSKTVYGLCPKAVEEFEHTMSSLNHDYKFPVDGLVMKRHLLPERTSSEVCYTAQAFKFDSESAITTVKSVEWRLSKTRYLIPRIKVETVNISGTNVSFCTGYNAQYIQTSNIGPGTTLRVSKHGEIIPNVDEVIDLTHADMPTECPSCHSKLEWNGVHLQCPNNYCNNATIIDTCIWIQAIAPKDGFKDALILQFLEKMVKSKVLDSMSIEDIMSCNRNLFNPMARGREQQWIELWEALHNCPISLRTALTALNIPRFGEVNCMNASLYPKLMHDLLVMSQEPGGVPAELGSQLAERLGNANVNALFDNLDKFQRLSLLEDRIDWGEPIIHVDLAPVKVAITGKLSVKRSDFEAELRRFGYVAGELSRTTQYLITDDPNSGSSKNKKADEYGVEKLTEQDFRTMFMN